jgi:predicted DNA-binding transcriptional regulator AlpA
MTSPEQLTTDQVASLVGLRAASVREFVRRGAFPAPDGMLGRTPWWHASTVDAWLSNRRGPGRPRLIVTLDFAGKPNWPTGRELVDHVRDFHPGLRSSQPRVDAAHSAAHNGAIGTRGVTGQGHQAHGHRGPVAAANE